MAYGNTSVSALLNQARSALKKQQGLEEEVAAYEYDLSPKDQASFNKYQDFLATRIKQVQSTDPSKSLSLQRKITGAQRTFTSAELTRESIGIAEGNGSKPQKLNKMISLYRSALENGDENLAQRIQLQADQLQVQIQNEAMSKGLGGGGGGSSANDAAAKKGINQQLGKIESAQKELKRELSTGKISSNDYISQIGQLYDAQNKVLSETYQVDKDGNIVQNAHSGLSFDSVKSYYDKHQGLLENDSFQKIMGNNPNVPFELRQAQIGNAFNTKLDPLTGEVKLEPNNIVGLRRMTEFGSTLAAPTVENNVDSGKYKEGFKSLGLSGGDGGSINKTYNTYGGEARNAKFYLDNPDKPGYAYTQDEAGVRYALDKSGNAVMLGDSREADKQIGELKKRLADPNISPQEREAIQKEIMNVNTDALPPDLLPGMQDAKDANYGGLGGVGRRFGVNTGKLLDAYNKQSALKKITELGGNLGLANPLASLAGFAGSTVGALGKIGDLTQQLTGLKQKSDAKNAAEAAQRAAEYQANLQANQQAAAQQQAYQAQIAAQNRQNVALPYKATPAGKAEANRVGSPTFNDKYLGTFGENSLYNKYLR